MLSKATAPVPQTPGDAALLRYIQTLEGRIADNAAAIEAVTAAPDTSLPTAADNLFTAWSYDSFFASSTAAATSGTLYVEKTQAAATNAITSIRTAASAYGSGITLLKVAVFDAAGVQLGVSADASATFSGSAGTVTLASPTRALVVGETLYLAFLSVGGTAPTLRTATSATPLNYGLAAADGYRSSTLASQTDMPASLTLSGLSSNTSRRWFAAQHA